MKNGFYLYPSDSQVDMGLNKAIIDGADCPTLLCFGLALSQAFRFPNYFSENLHSLEEVLNDLSWLEGTDFAIVIYNYSSFLSAEPDSRKAELMHLLWETASQWQHVPNYPGEEAYRERAAFRIYVDSCTQISSDLGELDIPLQGKMSKTY